MEEKKTEGNLLSQLASMMDRFTGDKVILLIAMFLMLISVISVFSSTPRLANDTGSDRTTIMLDQLKIVALGFGVIFLFYFFGRVNFYRKISMLGFVSSFLVLSVLVLNLNLGFIRAGEINGARRILIVLGKQIHIYEWVKLFMVMYLGWALDTYKNGSYKWAEILADRFPRLAFLSRDGWQKILYIYLPIAMVTLMVSMGSNSSALFIGAIMILMVMVGGLDFKDIAWVAGVLVLAFGLMFASYKAGILKDSRLGTLVSRITNDDDVTMQQLLSSKRESLEWRKAKGKLDQPVGAQLAIKEGGAFGKGIGNSTQKYQVPVIFGDYMFSFIVEETGLWGAFILIILYFSLFARGSLVAKECEHYYDKMIVTGLTILVTGQAFMHMAVNVHLPFVPQTGQTLPLVSHGTNAFIVFAFIFGILLSISKDAYENMKRRQEEAPPIIETSDWTQDTTA